MEDIRQTEEYAAYLSSIGWQTKKINNTNCYSKKILYPSILKIQRPKSLIRKKEIYSLAKKTKSIYILIEPSSRRQYQYYKDSGWKNCKSPFLPTKTIRFDLTKSDKDLLSQMHPKTRYNIGLSKRKGIKIRISQDIEYFIRNWNKAAKTRGMFVPMSREIRNIHKSFGKKSQIVLAYLKNNPIAGVLLINADTISYYIYAYSTELGNKHFAPSLLVWQAIQKAKEANAKEFDFEGINDKRLPLPSWEGFTRFKKGFGGETVEFPLPLYKYRFSSLL